MTCALKKHDPRIHSDNAFFFHHAVGNDRPGCLGWNGFPTRGKKLVWSNGPNKKKGRTDQRKPGGKTRVGIWFPHKKHEVPPTHTLKEYVADTTYIDVDSVLLKIKRDSNQVQNMKQSLCQNRKHITATERHSLQMCLFVKQLFEVCRQITNHRLKR